MSRPTKTGGVVKTTGRATSKLNKSGTSNTKHLGQPNVPNWIPIYISPETKKRTTLNGSKYKGEPLRQCAAENHYTKLCIVCTTKYNHTGSECPECHATGYYFIRCDVVAEPGKETCLVHGAGTVLTKEHADKCVASSIKTGFNFSEILLCTETCAIHDTCDYKDKLVSKDRYGSSLPRCLPEQAMYDSVIHQFNEEYDLDAVADQVMLDSLAMAIVRRARGQKILAINGELTERVRTSPDGTYERWFEPNAISSVVDALDKRTQAWIKELNVSKAAREGKTSNVNINLLSVLSKPITGKGLDEDMIIDVNLDD